MWWEWLFVLLGMMLVIPLVLAGVRRIRVQHRFRVILHDGPRGPAARRPPFAG